MGKYIAGADIGGSHISVCIVDVETGKVLDGTLSDMDVNSAGNASEIIAVWAGAVKSSVEASGVMVEGLGIAIPGPFDYEKGICTIEGVDKYDNLFGLDVSASLLPLLDGTGIDSILYTNDAAAFALGEYFGGAAKGYGRAVVFTLGTGLGSGFIADGVLVTDGDMVPDNGWVYNIPYEDAIADDKFTTRWFVKRYMELAGAEVSGAKDIADIFLTDDRARQIFEEYGARLAGFARPVCEKFGGEVLVLGGNISKAWSLFKPSMQAGMGSVRVVPAGLHDSAAMIGAASLHV